MLSVKDDEPERGHNAPVSTGSAEDAPAYSIALLRVQGNMGLDYPLPDFLHGDNGTV